MITLEEIVSRLIDKKDSLKNDNTSIFKFLLKIISVPIVLIVYAKNTDIENPNAEMPIIYGDFYFTEAILKLKGAEFFPW